MSDLPKDKECLVIIGRPYNTGDPALNLGMVEKLIGMDVLPTGETIASEVETLKKHWDEFDFFFFHVKKTDSYGEDGNFDAKVHVIEEADAALLEILALNPDVVLISGDHSTPCALKAHSWHEVPVLLWSKHIRPDDVEAFG